MTQQIASGTLGPVYVNETDSKESIASVVYVDETTITTVNATLSVTLDNTTLTATADAAVNATFSVTLGAMTLLATAHVDTSTIVVLRGGPPIRYVPEFDFRTLRAEFRNGDERVVLEEVVEATQQAIVEDKRAVSAIQLAKEIKRLHEIRLTEQRVRQLIDEIRKDAAFRAERKRLIAKKQDDEDEDETMLLLVS